MPHKRVLLAEKDATAIEAQLAELSLCNLTVVSANTAEAALAIHKAGPVDLVLADLDLKEMGGDRLCEIIKSNGDASAKTFVILACGGRKSELERCGKCGADAYFKTPITPKDLSERLGRILELAIRRATRVLVKVSVQTSISSDSFFATSRDISVSGILLETDKTLARGDMITCSFFLPDLDRIVTECKVVRVEKVEGRYLYGVVFAQLPESDKTNIENFVNRERESGNFK